MDDKIQTSQQRAGEHHLVEGDSGASAPAVQYGTDQASPGGVTEPVKGEIKQIPDPFTTSQQRKGELSLPEGR